MSTLQVGATWSFILLDWCRSIPSMHVSEELLVSLTKCCHSSGTSAIIEALARSGEVGASKQVAQQAGSGWNCGHRR